MHLDASGAFRRGVASVLNQRCTKTASLDATHQLVHLHSDSTLGDIPNDTRLSVVELVRHACLDRRVHLDVDVVADLEDTERISERSDTILTVSL